MDRFLEESWKKTTELEKELTPEEKAISVLLTVEEEVSKIKNKKDRKYLEGILRGLSQEVDDFSKEIEVIEGPFGKRFTTQKVFENKRRINHNSLISSLLTLYRYLRKEKLNINWAEDLGYDDNIRDDLKKFDDWELTDWAINLNKALSRKINKEESQPAA